MQNSTQASPPPPGIPAIDETIICLPRFMPFFWLGLAGVVGSVIADWLRIPWWTWLIGLLGCASYLVWRVATKQLQSIKQLPLAAALGLLCLSASLFMLSLNPSTPNYVHYYLDSGKVELTGIVRSQPKKQQNNLAVFVEVSAIRTLEVNNAPLPTPVAGQVLLRLPLSANYAYGDSLHITGELTEPSDGTDFSYRDYLGHRGINSMMYYPWVERLDEGGGNPVMTQIYRLSDFAKQTIDRLFPDPESGLLKGILLGDQSSIPPDLKRSYTLTGTAHIIAISGFNMAVLATVISRLTKKLHLVSAGLITICVLAFYTVLVGASASVVRAAIMSSYVILGRFIGRKGNLLNSLGVCVMVMVLIDPHAPWDVGFQLSVMATLGLSIYMSPLQARLGKWLSDRYSEEVSEKFTAPIANTFLVTLVAQASVMPLLLYHFREVSPLFLLANPLILPLQPALMISGLTVLTISMLWFPLGNLLKWLPWVAARYTNAMVSFLGNALPEGLRFPRLDSLWIGLFYVIIIWVTLRPTRRGQLKPSFHPFPAFSGLLVGIIVAWTTLGGPPDGTQHLRVFNRASNPTIFLMGTEGETVLIGGSMPPRKLTEQILSALPVYSHYLNAVVIPVCKQADVKGLFGLEARFTIDTVFWACDHNRIQTTQRLYDSFAQAHIKQVDIKFGEILSVEEDVQLFFEPDDNNDLSIRVKVDGVESLLVYGKVLPERPAAFTVVSETYFYSKNIPSSKSGSTLILKDLAISGNHTNLLDSVKFEWVELIFDDANVRVLSEYTTN